MKPFEFFAAKDSNHAVTLLAQHAGNAKVKIIAGGTDLLADLNSRLTGRTWSWISPGRTI